MSEHRDEIVKRVMHALEETRDPESLVWAYFDEDRDVVMDAARQTLEATREDTDERRISEAVDRELIEGLRFPPVVSGGLPARLYVRRATVAGVSLIVAILTMLLVLL